MIRTGKNTRGYGITDFTLNQYVYNHHSVKLKFHWTVFPHNVLVTSSRGCHTRMLRGKLFPWNLSFTPLPAVAEKFTG